MNKRSLLTILMLCLLLLVSARHLGPDYDARPRYSLDKFAQELAKKHQLKVLNCGLGHLADSKEGLWAISFTSDQKLTLEEGRELAAALSYNLLSKIFHHKSFKEYCEISEIDPLKEEYVGFRLAFWDEHTNRPTYPHLAQIRLADGKLYFHYAEPGTQKLQEPIVEPLNLPDYRG